MQSALTQDGETLVDYSSTFLATDTVILGQVQQKPIESGPPVEVASIATGINTGELCLDGQPCKRWILSPPFGPFDCKVCIKEGVEGFCLHEGASEQTCKVCGRTKVLRGYTPESMAKSKGRYKNRAKHKWEMAIKPAEFEF